MSFMKCLLSRISGQSGLCRTRRRRPFSPFGIQAAQVETLEDRRLLSGQGLPYATAATVTQLIADISYADKAGGAITIHLAPNTTFNLKTANNSTNTNGANGLPVIGGTKAVALTIVGNGDAIDRVNLINKQGVPNFFRLFDVAPGASLTLDHVTLKGGYASWAVIAEGGAIYNQGTLKVINGSILSGNQADRGGGIYNAGGTVTVSNSTLSLNGAGWGGGIYEAGGTVTVSNGSLSGNSASIGGGIYNAGGTVTVTSGSTLSGNVTATASYPQGGGAGGGIYNAGGTVTISNSILSNNTGFGGGIYNDSHGTVTVENSSSITWNTNFSDEAVYDVDNLGVLNLDSTSTIGILFGNPAILV